MPYLSTTVWPFEASKTSTVKEPAPAVATSTSRIPYPLGNPGLGMERGANDFITTFPDWGNASPILKESIYHPGIVVFIGAPNIGFFSITNFSLTYFPSCAERSRATFAQPFWLFAQVLIPDKTQASGGTASEPFPLQDDWTLLTPVPL